MHRWGTRPGRLSPRRIGAKAPTRLLSTAERGIGRCGLRHVTWPNARPGRLARLQTRRLEKQEKAMADSNWEDALIHLHEMGWDTDDIDSACEALVEACREGVFEGNEPSDLDSDQLKQILGGDMSSSEQEAVVTLAEVRAQEDPEAEAMREALWDIDEFAESR